MKLFIFIILISNNLQAFSGLLEKLTVTGVSKPVVLLNGQWNFSNQPQATPEFELMDVKLAKEANMNFVRTSHYAPPERFVELCDEYGIFLEAETGGCFVNFNRPSLYGLGITENDSAYTRQYLEPLKEMVSTLRSNPSVIIWSRYFILEFPIDSTDVFQ